MSANEISSEKSTPKLVGNTSEFGWPVFNVSLWEVDNKLYLSCKETFSFLGLEASYRRSGTKPYKERFTFLFSDPSFYHYTSCQVFITLEAFLSLLFTWKQPVKSSTSENNLKQTTLRRYVCSLFQETFFQQIKVRSACFFKNVKLVVICVLWYNSLIEAAGWVCGLSWVWCDWLSPMKQNLIPLFMFVSRQLAGKVTFG